MTTTDTSGKQVAEVTMTINHCYLQDYLKTELKNFYYVGFLLWHKTLTNLPPASSLPRYPWWHEHIAIAWQLIMKFSFLKKHVGMGNFITWHQKPILSS